jgi:hypothetical protein
VPSARFIGGRELELLTRDTEAPAETPRVDDPDDQPNVLAALASVVQSGLMLMPTQVPGVGPFPHNRPEWIETSANGADRIATRIPNVASSARRAAASLYAALNADVSLQMIGACKQIVIEGRFTQALGFARSLAALRRDCNVFVSRAEEGVAFGALRLVYPHLRASAVLDPVRPVEPDLAIYRDRWRQGAEARQASA